MSAVAVTSPVGRSERDRELPLAPAEGWLTVVLVALQAAIVAWSIDDGAWVLGREELTNFLVPVSVAGVLAGVAGAKSGWPRWLAHLAGALVAAAVIPVIAAGLLPHPADASVLDLYRESARVVAAVWRDFAVLHRTTTQEYGHYLLIFGMVAWGTGQFAGYAVFGHRRPFDAAVVLGLILLVSMAINEHDQLPALVLFSAVTLLLVNRSHALSERTTWLRERLGDPGAVRDAYLRGGALFVAAAVLGAATLTATARSAPLQEAFAALPQRLVDLTQSIQRFLPTGGSNRSVGAIAFGSTLPIANRWGSQDGIAFTAQLPAGETDRFYWRAVAYSRFDLNAWTFGDTRTVQRAAGSSLLDGMADDPSLLEGRRQVRITVMPDVYRGEVVLAPQTIVSLDRGSSVTVSGAGGYFSSVTAPGGGPYDVTSAVPSRGDGTAGGLTENRLRAAGTDYPSEIRSLYLQVPAGALGPSATALLERIRSEVERSTPYDTASRLVDFFRSPTNFTYTTDMRDAPCAGLSTVECFATVRRGFCQWYATTMTIMLRELGIPARYVEGFLPGSRSNGLETVLYSSAHAWVEVWFPGYGWVEFDPTGGGIARNEPLPSGAPVPPSQAPSSAAPGGASSNPDDNGDIAGPGDIRRGPGGSAGTSPGPFVLIAVALAVLLAGAGLVLTRRSSGGPAGPEQAWRGLGGLAGRFGLGPRPAQTPYEYAGALSRSIPRARTELATVARAKVEVAYGRQSLGEDRLRAVQAATARIRLSLLRHALRGALRRPVDWARSRLAGGQGRGRRG